MTLRRFFLLCLFNSWFLLFKAQETTDAGACIPSPDCYAGQEVLRVAEQMPEYPGGTGVFLQYLQKNLVFTDHIDPLASHLRLTFVIDTLGKAHNACLFHPLQQTPLLDAQLHQLLEEGATWKPAMQHDRLVCVRLEITMIICFR